VILRHPFDPGDRRRLPLYICIVGITRNKNFDSKCLCQFIRLTRAILAVWHQRQHDPAADILQLLACNRDSLRIGVAVAAAIERDLLVGIGNELRATEKIVRHDRNNDDRNKSYVPIAVKNPRSRRLRKYP
jgi:hypothetical protein